MKTFTIVLLAALAVAVLANPHKGGKGKNNKSESGESGDNKGKRGPTMPSPPAGCENMAAIKNANATTCCPSLPRGVLKSVMKNCSFSLGGWCGRIECIASSFDWIDSSTGFIDPAKAVTVVTDLVNGATKYDIKSIVDTCWSAAPAYADQLEAIFKNRTHHSQKWAEHKKAEKGQKGGKGGKQGPPKPPAGNGTDLVCKNSTRVNGAFMKCLKRQFIIQCPDWQSTDSCTELMNFAKSCPLYPIHGEGCDKMKKNGKGKKNEKQEDGKSDKNGKGKEKKEEKKEKKEEKKEKKEEKKEKKEEKKQEKNQKKEEKKPDNKAPSKPKGTDI